MPTRIGLVVLRGDQGERRRDARRPPKTLVNVPLFHVTGEVPVLLNSFVIGRGMVLMAKWDAGEALRLIEQEKVTYFVGVPTMSLELMQHPDRDQYDLSTADRHRRRRRRRARSLTSAGCSDSFAGRAARARLRPYRNQRRRLLNFWQNYADKPASTGRAHKPIVELAILGDGDGALAARASAARWRSARRPISAAYWRDPEATRAAFTADGYFRTGDIGYLDEDGYLFIVDRKKDIIIRGGENISCQEVEAAIYGHISVSEVCVFGIADERLGEVPAAVVYCEEDGTLNQEALTAFLQERLAAFKLPVPILVP